MSGIVTWWGGQSKFAKGIYIVGTLAAIGGIVYFATRKKKDDFKKSSNSHSYQDIPDMNSVSKDTTSGTPEIKPANTIVKPEPVMDRSTFPNGGKGCGEVKTTFDRDFDYVKCDGVWYTKSKPSAKIVYKEWKSLKGNVVANERLDRRYPNG